MLLRPTFQHFKVIGYYVGVLISAIGFLMVVPILTAVLFKEWPSAVDFTIGLTVTVIFGSILMGFSEKTTDLTWAQGMIVVALTWVVAALFGAIPLYLGGHYLTYLDAIFDTMSGFSTTGLAVIQNLDHLSNSMNMWRHFIIFIGGQGIAVVGLTFLVKLPGAGGAFEMYAGEARDEKIMPHVSQTSKFIWKISLVYLIIGVILLSGTLLYEGMQPVRSVLHAIWLFMAAWDTGGFAPQSQNILYYHSGLVELATMIFFVGGGLSFGLHYALWNRQRSEIRKNIETTTIFFSVLLLTTIVYISLWAAEIYSNSSQLFRKGFYHVLSASTTTGYQTLYSPELNGWAPLAFFAIVFAMAVGASASSTSGGIKALRLNISFRLILQEIKRLVLPETAVIVTKYHLIKDLVLQDKLLRSVFLVTVTYIGSYILGAAVIMFYGYPFHLSVFESISAAGNVGLSTGITSAGMPALIKVIFIIQMWAGRLEFMSIFAIIGTILALARGR